MLSPTQEVPIGYVKGKYQRKVPSTKGTRFAYDPNTGVTKRFSSETSIPPGWLPGNNNHPNHKGEHNPRYHKTVTEETRQKISNSNKGNPSTRGKSWFNNGQVQTLAFRCPEGYQPGQLQTTRDKRKGPRKLKRKKGD